MTTDCFESQIKRLRNRFGDNAFDAEFALELGKEVSTLSNYDFEKIVGMFVGNRKHNNPPLIVDFREARLMIEKEKLRSSIKQASIAFGTAAKSEPLEAVLARQGFAGCTTLQEALETQIRKNLEAKKNEDKPA